MTVETADTQAFSHTGKLRNIFGLALKNALFTIITLTLYRFWARTSIRRRVWSRTWIMGDPLEYTGAALELFRGFLIALPTFFLPAIFVLYIAPFAIDPIVAGWLTFAFYIFGVPMVAAARFWMRRYQLSRTRWRGIRMGLSGSAWAFAFASWGWTILQSVSFGWYTPAARMRRAKLMWENARFGDQPFNFEDDGKPLAYGLWWPFAMGWFGTIGVGFISFISLGVAVAASTAAHPGTQPDPVYVGVATACIAALAFVLYQLVWAPYNAAAMNRIASLISLDGARFKLRAKTFSFFFITLFGWIIIALSLTLLSPMAGLLQVRYAFNRLTMIGQPRFADIGQSIVVAPEVGESFGDAFDLDMGVGVI